MQSQQPGAQHAQNSGDDRGLQEKPPGSPPTHHHEQHCDCSGVIQIAGQHHLSGPEVGYSHRLHCQKGPAEVVLSSPAEEVQPATGLTETVLLRHHWIHPLHFYNCLVQQIWSQKTTESSPDCWANHWHNPPHFPRTVLIQSEQKAGKITLDPHIQHTPSLNCYRLADATELWAPERPDTDTVSSLRQYTSWTLNNKRGTLVLGGIPVHTAIPVSFK